MLEQNSSYSRHPEKLRIFSSPLVPNWTDNRATDESEKSTAEPRTDHGVKHAHSLPQFKRHNEPTLLEIFYDLFFAANYNVFSDTMQVTNHAKFKASVGYFCLLWLTWFEVALFDVRYATDSIFARFTRAIQLGVLVGFVVVTPKFDPTDQDRDTMRAMSLILAVSRACLAVEYASITWHVRKYKKAHLGLYLQIALHAAAALVCLGIAFCFEDGKRSRVYMTWYFISGAEAIGSLLLSNFYRVASLTETHLMKRMTLLTVMIMGNGIEQLAHEVVTIVRNPGAWDATTIGLVTAGAATIYFVFLIYFDWLRSSLYLPPIRQQIWTCLHLPFHLALVLFMQGFTQYLIWSKIVSQVKRLIVIADPSDDARLATSIGVRDSLNSSIQAFFKDYPPKIPSTWETVNDALNNITKIPDKFWVVMDNGLSTVDANRISPDLEDALVNILNTVSALVISMSNALFAAFGINLDDDLAKQNPAAAKSVKDGGYQYLVQDKTWNRYRLVFAYGYISAGCTMLLMAILTVIARATPHTIWPTIRLLIVFLLSLGTGLVSILWFSDDNLDNFLYSPWVMPTITLVWVVILILTHINGEGMKRNRELFMQFGRKTRVREHVNPNERLPAAPDQEQGKHSPEGNQEILQTVSDESVHTKRSGNSDRLDKRN
ncbi:hypothetical protein QQS21_001719 [Conoideocrella luteorostrata]|uniref:Low temperature requirement A n=1 Tax=Conoideocrella luteorostrata TaxID=1105319 RepID=A0AAJ0CZN4_9HYPO|nr:hypothetical protein QQS21_001719 [Conoideocrella luteorostrata]